MLRLQCTALLVLVLAAPFAQARNDDFGRHLRFLGSSDGGSSSSSSSATSTSSSSSDGGTVTETRTSASGGGWASGTAVATDDEGGRSESSAEAVSAPGGAEVSAVAKSEAEKGKIATAIAKAIGEADGGEVAATAIAKAVKEGDGDAVALAIAKAVKKRCGFFTRKDKCPKAKASQALVDAFASATNEADGLAYAEAFAIGLTSGGETAKAYARAVSTILENEGCAAVKPSLSKSLAVAVADGADREFADVLDFDIKIAECLYDECKGEVLICCANDEDECGCNDKGVCKYELWKKTPRGIWDMAGEKCLCPEN